MQRRGKLEYVISFLSVSKVPWEPVYATARWDMRKLPEKTYPSKRRQEIADTLVSIQK